MIAVIVIIIAILLLCLFQYNSLIQKKNAVDNAFYSMDVMLKKRYDLIPQLVSTVKGYMQHEKELLEQLTEMRQKAMTTTLGTDEKVDILTTGSMRLCRILL